MGHTHTHERTHTHTHTHMSHWLCYNQYVFHSLCCERKSARAYACVYLSVFTTSCEYWPASETLRACECGVRVFVSLCVCVLNWVYVSMGCVIECVRVCLRLCACITSERACVRVRAHLRACGWLCLVWKRVDEWVYLCVSACVCVCVYVRSRVVCVYVRHARAGVCVCICVCVPTQSNQANLCSVT